MTLENQNVGTGIFLKYVYIATGKIEYVMDRLELVCFSLWCLLGGQETPLAR